MLNCPNSLPGYQQSFIQPVLTVIKVKNHRGLSVLYCEMLSDVCLFTMVHLGPLSHSVGLLRTGTVGVGGVASIVCSRVSVGCNCCVSVSPGLYGGGGSHSLSLSLSARRLLQVHHYTGATTHLT